jgi:PKD repeat protein
MTVTANVKMALPVADFTADDTNLITFDSVQFTDRTSNSPTEWLWDFGDGYLSTLQNPNTRLHHTWNIHK